MRAPFVVGQEWELQARCRDHDPALFFGPNGFEPKRERLAREAAAKAICASCPVVGPCRAQSIVAHEAFGVWGGLGESDRRAVQARNDGTARRAG